MINQFSMVKNAILQNVAIALDALQFTYIIKSTIFPTLHHNELIVLIINAKIIINQKNI